MTLCGIFPEHANLQNVSIGSDVGKPVFRQPLTPQPFFSTIYIADYYLGDILPLANMLHREDIVFVMYYAPWSKKSNMVKKEFFSAAKFLSDRVCLCL